MAPIPDELACQARSVCHPLHLAERVVIGIRVVVGQDLSGWVGEMVDMGRGGGLEEGGEQASIPFEHFRRLD